jgi:hypothetical protein
MTLPPLRAAVLAATAILVIPCGAAQAQAADIAAPDTGQTPPAATTGGDGATVDTGVQTLAGGDDSADEGTTQAGPPPQEGEAPPSEPPPDPRLEPMTTPEPPPPAPATESAPPPPSGDSGGTGSAPRTGDGSGAPEPPQARDSSPSGTAESAGTSVAPPEPPDSSGGAPGDPEILPDATEVDRLLPTIETETRRPVAAQTAAAHDREPRSAPPPQGRLPRPEGHLIRLDPYTWVQSPAAQASDRYVAQVRTERKSEAPPASGPLEDGSPDNAPPSSPAPGSASASPGGGFFAAGLASLAALLICLAMPQLRARLELPPRGRCTVAFLRPLERPG